MHSDDPRVHAAESIQYAIQELSEALVSLDRIPMEDKALVAWVAHAMDNYLSVNEATLNLVEQAIAPHPSRELATWIEGLRQLGNLMHHTVGRLVRTSAAAEFPLKPEYVNLPLLMARACDHHRPGAAQKGLDITCRSMGEVPLAWADRVAVAVVADNLLSNAVGVSRPGGDIQVDVVPGPGGVMCSVRDHGPGLTPLQQAMLFHGDVAGGPMASAGEPATRRGLAVAKDFVDRMGGRLWCESQLGEGTCFSFRLPYHAEGPVASPVPGHDVRR
jgi:signal transduction histidine kinase